MSYRRIEYLNLELPNKNRGVLTLDKILIPCSFNKDQGNHCLHNNNTPEFNTLIDLLIELGENLESENKKHGIILEQISKGIIERNRAFKDFQKNLEYLKTVFFAQEKEILKTNSVLKQILEELSIFRNLPSKTDIIALSSLVKDNKPKDIEAQSKALILEIKNLVDKIRQDFENHISAFEKQLSKIEKLASE